MKTIYLDCSRGAAGDMLTAALFGLLPDEEKRAALDEMNAFGIPNTVYRPRKHNKMGIKTIQMTVLIDGEEESEMIYTQKHAAKHSRDYRTLRDVANIIAKLNASETARINAFKVYALLASAESKAHGVPVGEVHFHEVGSLDAIADIMGFCYLVEKLEAKKIVVSPIGVGCGTVECAHGVLSVPTPATAALLKGVPICNTNRKGEMCTPTGAAIIRFFANEYGKAPAMEVKSIAYSSGKRDYDWPNIVRALIGETEDPVVEEEPVAVEEPVAEPEVTVQEPVVEAEPAVAAPVEPAAPAVEETAPVVEETTPIIEEAVPVEEPISAPVVEEAPVAEEQAPEDLYLDESFDSEDEYDLDAELAAILGESNRVSRADRYVEEAPVAEPVIEELAPVAEEAEPAVEEAAPIVEEVAPVVEAEPIVEAAPVVEEEAPVAEPVIEELAPVVEEAEPAEEVAPIVEEVAPVVELAPIEEAAPVVEVAEEVVPVTEPVVEEAAPVVEAAPIVEEPVVEAPVVEAPAQTIPMPADEEAEIEALKRRLAELMGTPYEPPTPVAPVAAVAQVAEPIPEEAAPVVEAVEEVVPVVEEVTPIVEPIVEEVAPVIEEAAPVVEAVASVVEETVPVVEEVIEPAMMSDALSLDELEKDLFGDTVEGTEAEATKKIDKFYTLYKKNEEFQRLLDEEYNKLKADDGINVDDLIAVPEEPAAEVPVAAPAGNTVPAEAPVEVAAPAAVEAAAPAETGMHEVPAVPAEVSGTIGAAAPVEFEDRPMSKKEAKKAAKAAAKAEKAAAKAAKVAKDDVVNDEEEETGGALTVIAVIVALILVVLLAAILILNFAENSGIAMFLDSLIQNISSYFSAVDTVQGQSLL